MSVSVTWYGHSNFKVSCGDVTVFIDPFFTHNPSCPVTWNEAGKPDLVLVTHDHGDHTGDAVAICKSSGATCGCIVGTAERLIDAGMPPDRRAAAEIRAQPAFPPGSASISGAPSK